jgi:hypothetical protein
MTGHSHAVECAVESVEVKEAQSREVYDLMIEEDHEYFANSLLVHNCIDPLRYVNNYLDLEQSGGGMERTN